MIETIVIILPIALIALILSPASKETLERNKEIRNRYKWQREVYGFELKPDGNGVMEKITTRQTEGQADRYMDDLLGGNFQESYEEWERSKGL